MDPFARAFRERLEVIVTVDHDLVAVVDAKSALSDDTATADICDLEFGLSLTDGDTGGGSLDDGEKNDDRGTTAEKGTVAETRSPGAVKMRSNITPTADAWDLVPGEIVLKHNRFLGNHQLTRRQHEEKMYYERCVLCGRTIYEIERDDCDQCAAVGIAMSTAKAKARWVKMRSQIFQ